MSACEKHNNRARFGYEEPTHCGICKTSDMKELILRNKCMEHGKMAIYGYRDSFPECCKDCRKNNMIDIKHRKCKCNKGRPTFNFEGNEAEYCKDCKKIDMVDVVNKKCFCQKSRPTFNFEGKRPRYCKDCKESNMIDVVNKKCKCNKHIPFFNYPNKKPKYCQSCKKKDMIDVVNKRCKCKKSRPSFNFKGQRPKYCADCKDVNMIDVTHTQCKTPLCHTIISKKYDGYCYRCFVHTFPDHELSRNYRTKEKFVTDALKNKYPIYDFTFDKRVQGGCSKRRPDVYNDFGDWILIVEIDENQHSGYTCENKRLMEISKDFDHRPIKFIRFNPDSYKIDGEKVPSPWSNTKNGYKLSDKKEWNKRIQKLFETIDNTIDDPPSKTIDITELFYSN